MVILFTGHNLNSQKSGYRLWRDGYSQKATWPVNIQVHGNVVITYFNVLYNQPLGGSPSFDKCSGSPKGKAKLSAEYVSIIAVPVIITDCTPSAFVEDFSTAEMSSTASHTNKTCSQKKVFS